MFDFHRNGKLPITDVNHNTRVIHVLNLPRTYDHVPFSGVAVVLNSVVLVVVEDGVLMHLLSPEIHVSQDSSILGHVSKIMH